MTNPGIGPSSLPVHTAAGTELKRRPTCQQIVSTSALRSLTSPYEASFQTTAWER
jgi:hypothetical protein